MARHWLGIDIGGTFTDFALFDTQTGELLGLKVPSTPHEFAEAVRVGLARLADEHGVDLREIGTVVHGTTIAVTRSSSGRERVWVFSSPTDSATSSSCSGCG